MFLEGILKKLILNQLVKLFPTLSRDQLTLHLSSGHMQLQNVPFPEQFAMLPLVKFRSGTIGLLEINLNWTALLRKPIKVTLKGVRVELEQTGEQAMQPINVKEEITKIEENLETQVRQQSTTNSDQQDSKKSILQRLMDSLVDNLEITIEDIDIHISNLLSLCEVDFKLDSFVIRNDTLTGKKTFTLSRLLVQVGVPEQQHFICLEVNGVQAQLDQSGGNIQLELELQSLIIQHAHNTLLELTSMVEDINTHTKRQGINPYALRVELRQEANQPVTLGLNFAGVLIQWRSHTFFEMQCLAQKIIKKAKDTQQSVIVDEHVTLDTHHDLRDEVINKVKIEIEIYVASVQGVFYNLDNCMGVYRCDEGRMSITAKQWEVVVGLLINNTNYQDATQYPHTQQAKMSFYGHGMPTLTTRHVEGQQDNFRFKLRLFDNDCPPTLIKDSIYNYVELEADNLILDYYQQPFLRLFDFLLEQIVNLMTNDYGPQAKTKKTREQWYQAFTSPKFTDLRFSVIGGHVRVYPIPHHQSEHLLIKFERAIVTNTPVQCTSRLPPLQQSVVAYIWEQLIHIQLVNAVVLLANAEGHTIRQLSNALDMNFQFAKLMFGWEYDQFVKGVDQRNDISAYIDKLQLQMCRYDYLLLMKLLFNNILFDDENDSWFLYNYRPESKTNPSAIRFQLKVNQIQVDICDYNELAKIISVETVDLRLCYCRLRDATSNLDFCVRHVYADQWAPCGTDLEVMGIINRNLLTTNQSLSQQVQVFEPHTSQHLDVRMLHYENEHFVQQPGYQLTYAQRNLATSKQILVGAARVQGVMNLQWYFHLMNFFFMDDAVYLVQMPNSLILRPLILELVLKDAIIILQCPNAENLIVLEGDVLVSFQKNTSTAIHENYHKLNPMMHEEVILNYNMNFAQEQEGDSLTDSEDDDVDERHHNDNQLGLRCLQRIIEQSPTSTLKAESGCIRVMVCSHSQLVECGFSRQSSTREIFSPLQVQWKSQNYLCQCTREHKMLNESSLQLEKFITQLTFNEFQLLSDTIMYLKDSMYESNLFVYSWRADPFPSARMLTPLPLSTPSSNINHVKDEEALKQYDLINSHYQLMSNSKKLFNFQAEVLFVNNLGGSFVPLIFLELKSFPLMIEQGYMKFLLAGNVELQANYYNIQCGKLEPVVEKCNFDVALLRNHDSYPRMSFQLEIQGQLNINIHQQMIGLLGNSLQKFKKIPNDTKPRQSLMRGYTMELRKRASKRKNIFQTVSTVNKPATVVIVNEQITLFQVENHSGYDLQVSAFKQKKDQEDVILPLPNNKKKNFMTRLDDDLMQTFTSTTSVNLDFTNLRGEKIVMRNLTLDCFQGRVDQWNKMDQERQLHKITEKFVIYTYVSQVSRVLLITSPLFLINRTQFDIKVRITRQRLEWMSIISNMEPQAIPVELIGNDAELQFGFEDTNLIEHHRHMSEAMKLYPLPQEDREMQHGPYKTVLRSETDPKYALRKNITFCTPITINNCLPVMLDVYLDSDLFTQIRKSIQLSGVKFKEDCISLDTQTSLQIPFCSLHQGLFMTLKINGFLQSDRIHVNDTYNTSTVLFKEKDSSGTTIVIIRRVIQGGQVKFYLYPKACLINTTLYPLIFYTLERSGNKKRIPGQQQDNQVVLCDEQTNLMVMMGGQSTNQVSIKGVGETSLEVKIASPENPRICLLHEFGLYITLVCTVPDLGLYSRVIQVAPRYVVMNHTENAIEVQQENAYGEPQLINPNERITLYWKDCRKEKMVVCRLVEKNLSKKSLWRWSGGIYVAELRTVHFYCSKKHHSQSTSKLFFKAVITKHKSTFYISIYDVAEGQYAYKLLNLCHGYEIHYQQKCFNPTEEELLPYNQLTPFAWPYPNLQPQLSVRMQTGKAPNFVFLINLYRFESLQKIKLPNGKVINVQYWFDKQTKIIAFNEDSQDQDPALQNALEKIMYVRLPLVTISLIGGLKPVELNLVTLWNVEFASQTQNNNTDYQFRVKFLQIDQNNAYDPVFQVNLTPQQYKALADGLDEEEKYHNNNKLNTLDVKCRKNSQEDQVLVLESFTVQLVPLNIKLDEEYVQLLLEFVRQTQEDLFQETQVQRDQILSSYEICKMIFVGARERDYIIRQLKDIFGGQINMYQEWQIVLISNPGRTIYIKDLVLFPLMINFSFQKSYNSKQENFFLYRVLANAFGTAISNIEDAPIVLSGFRTQNVYDTTQGITMQLKDHYTFGLMRQIIKLIGSIELIGNPLSFFNRISTGVVDFIEKPFDAIQKGPLELGLGIVEGATSLIKNTVAGTFYSINKVTGGISTQVSMLSMDEHFIQKRRRFMQRKPKQVFEGLYQGIFSILYGVGDGIIGVVQQPYYHGQKYGLSGVIKGSAIGVTALFIKSITGVLDAASKTAEGLTNTATHFDDKPNQERIRPVRPFYGKQHYIKVYSYNDAFLLTQFQLIRNGAYKDIELIDSFQLQDMEEGEMFLLISHQIIIYTSKSGVIKGEIQPDRVDKFSLFCDTNNNNIMRLIFEMKLQDSNQQSRSFRLKFKKIPYSQQLSQTLQNVINL